MKNLIRGSRINWLAWLAFISAAVVFEVVAIPVVLLLVVLVAKVVEVIDVHIEKVKSEIIVAPPPKESFDGPEIVQTSNEDSEDSVL